MTIIFPHFPDEMSVVPEKVLCDIEILSSILPTNSNTPQHIFPLTFTITLTFDVDFPAPHL